MLRAMVMREDATEPPNDEEIKLYASSIGIDVSKESYLLPIAKEGISASLPEGWQILQDENNQIFYYNSTSGKSLWDHPLDALYKKRVEEARRIKNKEAHTKNTPSTDDSSNLSCPTRGRPNGLEVEKNTTGTRIEQNPSTPQFNSVQKSSTRIEDKTYNLEWLTAPLLGDKIPTPRQTSLNTPSEQTNSVRSASESETATEYRELVHSQPSSLQTPQRRHTLLYNHKTRSLSKDTQAASTQMNGSKETSSISKQDWTLQHCASLTEADRRLTWLQTKLRQSLLSNNTNIPSSPLCSNKPHQIHGSRRSISVLHSPRHKITEKPGWDAMGNSKRSSHSSPLSPHSDQRPTRIVQNASGTASPLSSPPAKENGSDEVLSIGPQVGVSPSDSKKDESPSQHSKQPPENTKFPFSNGNIRRSAPLETREQRSQAVTHRSDHALLEHGQLEHPETARCATHIPIDGSAGFSVGLNHIAEERSRLQRKILRLKIIYKSYKERLASLDASLILLQQSVNVSSPCTTKPESSFSANSNGIKKSCSARGSPFSRTRLLVESDHPAVLNSSASSENTSTFRARSPNSVLHISPEIIDIQECSSEYRPRRSLSLPRQTSATSHFQQQPRISARMPELRRSVSRELAASLASIDAQLHRVLHQLDPNCSGCRQNEGAAPDGEDHENHPPKTGAHYHQNNGRYGASSTRFLQRQLANLSLSDHCTSHSALGDLRILTPLSPDNVCRKSLQLPRVNASPTWLQSD